MMGIIRIIAYETILSLTEQLHETTNRQEALMEEWQELNETLEALEQ